METKPKEKGPKKQEKDDLPKKLIFPMIYVWQFFFPSQSFILTRKKNKVRFA